MVDWVGVPVTRKYKDLNIQSLSLNRAYIIANSTIDNVTVYSVKNDCFRCPYKLAKTLRANEELAWEVDTGEATTLRIMNLTNYEYIANNYTGGLICQHSATFGEYGVYRLDVDTCVVSNEVPPIQSYLVLLPCALIVLVAYGIYRFIMYLINYLKKFQKPKVPKTDVEEGITCLNVFRGLLMTLLIFIISGGGNYPILNKTLGGVSIPDITFSALAWTIGVQVPQDVDAELAKGKHKFAIVWNILQSAIVMVFSSWISDSSKMQEISSNALWSPLKRMAFAYLFVACSYALTARKSKIKDQEKVEINLQESGDAASIDSKDEQNKDQQTREKAEDTLSSHQAEVQNTSNTLLEMTEVDFVKDDMGGEDMELATLSTLMKMVLSTTRILLWCWILFVLILGTLVSNTMFYLYLSCTDKTGFKQPKMNYSNVESDVKIRCGYWLTRWVRMVLAGEANLHADVNDAFAYNAGTLGTLSAILITMIGLKTGLIFVHFKSHPERLKLWGIWATLFGLIGLALLWVKTIASIFLIPSISMYILIIIYWCTDILKWSMTSLSTLGFNYLSILFGHLLFYKAYPFTFYELDNHLWCLIQNIWATSLWLFKGDYLVKKYVKLSKDMFSK